MNILAIILLIIWVLFMIRGIRKGFIGMLVGLASCILILFLVPGLTPKAETWLNSSQAVTGFAEKQADHFVTSQEKKAVAETGTSQEESSSDTAITEQMKKFGIPDNMQHSFSANLAELQTAAGSAAENAEQTIHAAAVQTISRFIIKGIAVILTLLLALVIVLIVRGIMRMVDKLPVIHGVSRFTGGILGLAEGYLVVCLILFLILCFSGTSAGGSLNQMITDSPVLSALQQHNIISDLIA